MPLVRVLVLAAFLVAAVQSQALAAKSTITVTNQSGQEVVAFYYRQTNTSDWIYLSHFGKLANGESFYWTIEVPYRYVDLGFRLADGNFQERTAVDTYSDFTLYVNH